MNHLSDELRDAHTLRELRAAQAMTHMLNEQIFFLWTEMHGNRKLAQRAGGGDLFLRYALRAQGRERGLRALLAVRRAARVARNGGAR